MSNLEKFESLKSKLLTVWPKDRITEIKEDKLIIQCLNGTYFKIQYLKIPEELREGAPAQLFAILDDKIAFYHGMDLDNWQNIGKEIAGMRTITKFILRESIQEFNKWLVISKTIF